MEQIAYKFVKWNIAPLEKLKDTKVYGLRVKCMNGKRLSREEKDWLAAKLSVGRCGRTAIALQGWMFSFYDYMNRYLVRRHGVWEVYYAPDRTSLRRALYGRIDELHEIPKPRENGKDDKARKTA